MKLVDTKDLKQVPTAEYNPLETIKTKVLGAQNLIEEAKWKNYIV